MPIDIYGNRAQIIMDPGAVISRMNAGRLYEFYFNSSSRHVKAMVSKWLAQERTTQPTTPYDAIPEGNMFVKPLNEYSDEVINAAFNIVVDFLKIIGTEQYTGYKALTKRSDKETILNDILAEELYIYYRLSSERRPYQIAKALKESIYMPIRDRVKFTDQGKEYISKGSVRISPQYTILLGKTADNFLSTPSAKTNHFGLGVGISNAHRNRAPSKNVPVKNISETEGRLYRSYAEPYVIAELKDRANSLATHKEIYKSILTAKTPTNIPQLIDRRKMPYGNDAALQVVENVFNAAGIGISYVRDKKVFHPLPNQPKG